VHGEMNAIYNACHSGASLDGATLYVTGLPVCSECAKGIIQVGIKRVIMEYPKDIPDRWRNSMKTTSQMFKESGVVFLTYEV
jgi:dCMP deaminase